MLLVIAVVLPTVCLLWFMSQTVKNERLAIRQKLIDIYTAKLPNSFANYCNDYWGNIENKLIKNIDEYEDNLKIFPEKYIEQYEDFSAFVIYEQGKITYPIFEHNTPVLSDRVCDVWKLEYVDRNFQEAIKQYEFIGSTSSIMEVVYECKFAIVRCLSKQGELAQAIAQCELLAYQDANETVNLPPKQIALAGLMLVNLYGRTNNENLLAELEYQLSNSAKLVFPTETKMFVLGKLIALAAEVELSDKLKSQIENAERIINCQKIALAASGLFESSMPEKTFRNIPKIKSLYGISFRLYNGDVLGLVTSEKMSQFWQETVEINEDEIVFCRVADGLGLRIDSKTSSEQPFLSFNPSGFFPDWKIEVYFRQGVFAAATRQQQVVYFWIAILVIVFMTLLVIFSARAILRQAKMNRLKNDFIATVTHELKTPLSSMRVLVDTILQGNYEEEKTATEYMKLISKENARLSRLIDNFLTFSRMERNKQAFNLIKIAPAKIAESAVEAMRTKFNNENCRFNVAIDENLPFVLADKDAMITVLVNLLDNAYKYSYDDKQIELKVFGDEAGVCFSVKDNGIGMTRRQMRKIFDRFYQADSSLARSVEGTGLGLSIVKFIIDAHKGEIEVESKPGKGSEFRVVIPICKD